MSGPCSAATANLRTCRGCGPAVDAGPACNWPRWRSTFTRRASPGAKRWRQWFPIRRYWARFCAAAASVLPAGRVIDWPFDMPAPSLLLRMIVPGWAQRYAGRPIRGRWIFWCYVGFLLSGLLFAGTTLSRSLLGLAISLHAASVLDVVAATVSDFRDRLVYTVVTAGVTHRRRRITPPDGCWHKWQAHNGLPTSAPPFEEGDVVLVNPFRLPMVRSDSRVMWFLRFISARCTSTRWRPHHLSCRGDRIDRVIAHAGHRVTLPKGELLVDGGPSPWLPLNPATIARRIEYYGSRELLR